MHKINIGNDCKVCEGRGRIQCLPDEEFYTHPCDTCQPEANEEFQRGVKFSEHDTVSDNSAIQSEIIAFAVKDYADGWILFSRNERERALRIAAEMGSLFCPLYAPASPPASTGERGEE